MAVSIGFLLRGILLWAAYLGMILVNVLSQALPIGNKTNSEIANANPVRSRAAPFSAPRGAGDSVTRVAAPGTPGLRAASRVDLLHLGPHLPPLRRYGAATPQFVTRHRQEVVDSPSIAESAGLLVLFVLPGRGDNPRFAAAAPWLAANFVTNAAWLVVFQYEFYWYAVPPPPRAPRGRSPA